MKFKVIDCCPAPAKLYPELLAIKQATGCTYASIYRGTSSGAAKYLTGGPPCYKHTQAWIYANYPPGVANPPGRSTHECRNDGVAYPGPAYMPLPWWCCGIDVDDAHVQAVCNAARARGWIVTVTYPGSAVEYHHVNFRKEPHIKSPFKPLKHGSHGPRVKRLTKKLRHITRPGKRDAHYMHHVTNQFGDGVRDAIKQFQRDYHLTPDGVVGIHTKKQLAVCWRHWKKHH
jgi:peptidoglycan hydrolase-like protein with peptidoglycan-binding domain